MKEQKECSYKKEITAILEKYKDSKSDAVQELILKLTEILAKL